MSAPGAATTALGGDKINGGDEGELAKRGPIEQVEQGDQTQTKKLPIGPKLSPKRAGMSQDVFTLPEGEAIMQWPERLSAESFQDFSDWLNLLLRKIRRSVVQSVPASTEIDVRGVDETKELFVDPYKINIKL